MRVLIINTSERIGGAAVASYRLMEALKSNGIKAKMLVRDKQTEQITVACLPRTWKNKFHFVWERGVIWMHNHFSKQNLFAVSLADSGTDITCLPEFKEADVIHLAWINQGMLSLQDIKKILSSGKPVVWTMHDMWPCTGICHHARECTNYQKECHNCPFLYNGGGAHDLSYKTFTKKKKIYHNANITFVACSKWLASLAKQSALLADHKVMDIPNPINIHTFCPDNERGARDRCHLPQDKKLILFGSVKITDKRKGIDYLIEACQQLVKNYPGIENNVEIVVFGNNSDQLKDLVPFPVRSLDFVSSEPKLAEVYNAVDVYVTPSLEENLPNMIMESLACGTPCVGFRIGGIPEMIDHLQNGYVAEYKSSEDLAKGIYWCLNEADPKILKENCVRKVLSNYSEGTVAQQYIHIYNQITGNYA